MAAESKKLLVLVFVAMVSSLEAYVFYAGGRDGWVVDPAESYNHWAERNRFQINDTIVFAKGDGADSVLVVTEPDFDACSTSNPVRRLEDAGGGRSEFQFDRSGAFFFISGDEDRCQKGRKLYVIVMAARPTRPAPLAPAPGSPPPSSWASAPEYAQAPGMTAGDEWMSRSSSLEAPPPTAGAARLDGAIASAVLGVLGALVL
uniref:Uncharacterized protein n=1 Tax=Avena sativa TaxID=4498 RepID=A0ACD5W3V9_AVESA